jgi:hypothetical protein
MHQGMADRPAMQLNLCRPSGVYPALPIPRTTMQVRITRQLPDGTSQDFGTQELNHMPPVGEPFSPDQRSYYTAKAYFGPDQSGHYLLVLEGEPLKDDRTQA